MEFAQISERLHNAVQLFVQKQESFAENGKPHE
jgi:hypothetical protein